MITNGRTQLHPVFSRAHASGFHVFAFQPNGSNKVQQKQVEKFTSGN